MDDLLRNANLNTKSTVLVEIHDNHTAQAMTMVPCTALLQGFRVRNDGLNPEHVKNLADMPGALPPIVVHQSTMTIVDGMHRIAAARARGQEEVQAVLFDGTIVEAYLLALKLNSVHGLPLSRKDRQTAVVHVLDLRPTWSDRRIAGVTGVSHKTVGAIRKRSGGEIPQLNRRLGKDGRERPLNSKEARRQATQLLSEQPSATVRQVAAATGLAPSTIHNVRQGMADEPPPEPQTTAQVSHLETLSRTLEKLRADPSLRATVAGRTLLQLLSAHVRALTDDDLLAKAVPAHRRNTIAELARRYGDAWHGFASEIEQFRT